MAAALWGRRASDLDGCLPLPPAQLALPVKLQREVEAYFARTVEAAADLRDHVFRQAARNTMQARLRGAQRGGRCGCSAVQPRASAAGAWLCAWVWRARGRVAGRLRDACPGLAVRRACGTATAASPPPLA
jgi:hypothetical protein